MRMGTRQLILLAAILAAAGAAAAAQTPVVNIAQENFENGAGGWTINNVVAGTGWAVDPPGDQGAGSSLNYNNGTDYDSGGINSGTARSPNYTVASPTYTNFVVTFRCRRETEEPGMVPRNVNQLDTCVIRISDANGVIGQPYQLIDFDQMSQGYMGLPGHTAIMCNLGVGRAWHTHTINLPRAPVGTIAVQFEFNTVDAQFNTYPGWFVDNLSIDAVDPGGGGGGGGGGGYEGPGYYDANGVYVGFPNGGAGLPPPAAPPGTGAPAELGSYDANGVYVGTGPTSTSPTAPPATGTPAELGYYDANGVYIGTGPASGIPVAPPGTGAPIESGTYNANGVYVGTGPATGAPPLGPTDTGTAMEPGYQTPVPTGGTNPYVGVPGSGGTSTGEGAEGSDGCGLLGLEFLLPLALLRFARRRR